MLFVFFSIAISFFALVLSDWLLKKQKVSQEFARKFSHIIAGTFVAFWPWFITWNWIAILAVSYLMLGIITRKTNLFKNVRFVNRLTWGEYFYPLGVIALCYIQPSNVIFVVAMLHFSFADAFAAIVGRTYGRSTIYKVFGQTKSVVGSLAFFAVSFCLVGGIILVGGHNIGSWALLIVPMVAMCLENVSPYGSDNLIVPVVVALLLQ